MRRAITVLAVAAAWAVPATAHAEITSVFENTSKPISCAVQGSGQRFCGTGTGTTVPSWDGTPIDVSVALPPAPSEGQDGSFPVVGIYHGWAGSKSTPSASATSEYQRWLQQGYAVVSISDRGFGKSCGTLFGIKPSDPACATGYLHLMHNAFEVRDAQHLFGYLADQGVIDGRRIGATGGSYGGGMAVQLGALRNRVQLPDGSLIPWESPGGLPMEIAATAPEYGWTDLAQALIPNGSSLDYAADAPYDGPDGTRRVGIQKQAWNSQLYTAGSILGYYSVIGADPAADIRGWNKINDTGGPFDDREDAAAMVEEMRNHGAYSTPDDIAPAPTLLSSGWNDDLFPVDESVTYYNKTRSKYPNAPIRMYHLDFGHSNRAATAAASAAAGLRAAENEWFAHYIKGEGNEPERARGGVDTWTSSCPAADTVRYEAESWATIAPGELRQTDSDAQTIVAPGTKPNNAYTSGTVCTESNAVINPSAATYVSRPAHVSGYTIVGTPTVIADLDVTGANDAVISRLYDVDQTTGKQRLIARGLYRPVGVGQGPTRQIFQLHPQAYRIAPGHEVKLELLAQDATYARIATGQMNIEVTNLELRLPVIEGPGDLGGQVKRPAQKILPDGFVLARDFDTVAPTTTIESGARGTVTSGDVTFTYTSSKDRSTFECRLDESDWEECEGTSTFEGLASGQYQFAARATDRYGRTGPAVERIFTVLLPLPPVVEPPVPPVDKRLDPRVDPQPPVLPAPVVGPPAAPVLAPLAKPEISVTTTGRRARRGLTVRTAGTVRLPEGVVGNAPCHGTLTVQVKRGRTTVSTRRVPLQGDCRFSSTVTFKRALRGKTLQVYARFNGNRVLAARSAAVRSVKLR